MVFDECTQHPATRDETALSMQLSMRWAQRSKAAHEGSRNALFGIVQGGMYEDLRDESLAALESELEASAGDDGVGNGERRQLCESPRRHRA